MSSTASSTLQDAYVLGLLQGCRSITQMIERGILPKGKAQTCRQLTRDPAPYQHALERRLPDAPEGAYLAIDLLPIEHAGERIEGVGRHYSTSSRSMQWGHHLVSSGLVQPGQDPYLLRCDPFLDARMATRNYPHLSPSEALLTVVGAVITAGYPPKAVLADTEFTTALVMRSLKALGVPFVLRGRPRDKVLFEAQWVPIREVARQFPPGRARWYPRLKRYVRRVPVVIEGVGEVELLIVWKAQGVGWHLSVLLSTLLGGVQDVMLAAHSRWSLEVSHRTRKQNLALERCSCFSYAAHLLHADLVIEAFNRVRLERARSPGLSWKQAQALAAQRAEHAVLTGATRLAAA